MMKWSVLTVLAASVAAGSAAWAQRPPADRGLPGQACVQAGSGVSHMVATVQNPADCCTGRMQCAQFLSTSIVARPSLPQRT